MPNSVTSPTHKIANFVTLFTDKQTDHTAHGVDAVR